MSELAPKFQYDPPVIQNGRSFRLLQLHPATSRDDILRFDLKTVSLDDRHFYDTISYTWDAQPLDVQALCEGKPFFITRNCQRILTTLRLEDRIRLVWIDQICINQSSLEDRSRNVANMGDIYRYPGNVIIWPGELDDKIKEFLFRISGDCRATVRECIEDPNAVSLKMFRGAMGFNYAGDIETDKKMYLEFVASPWFHRMWTFQEFVILYHDALYFLVDDALLSYMRFSTFEVQHVLPSSTVIIGLQTLKQALLGQLRLPENRSNNEWTLSSLLKHLIGRRCGDPRDQIFAILAALSALGPERKTADSFPFRPPDYSLPVSQVYEKATLWALSEQKDVRILYLAAISTSEASRRHDLRNHCTSDLPSWVPDLQYLSYLDRPDHPGTMRPKKPWPKSKLTFEYVPSSRAIRLKGLICDTLQFIGTEFIPCGTDFVLLTLEVYFILGTWWSEMRAFAQQASGFSCTAERFLSIAKGSIHEDPPRNTPPKQCFQAFAEQYTHLAENVYNGGNFNTEVTIPDELKEFENEVRGLTSLYHQTLLISEHGLIGTGLGDFQVGDKIAIAAGFDQLLILRAFGSHYQLIGHANMDGLMDGEAWPEDESKLMGIEIR